MEAHVNQKSKKMYVVLQPVNKWKKTLIFHAWMNNPIFKTIYYIVPLITACNPYAVTCNKIIFCYGKAAYYNLSGRVLQTKI